MKVLVIYDSTYGNTEKIAGAIGGAIGGDIKVIHAGQLHPRELESADLIIVGAPTNGGRPTPAIQDFLRKVPVTAISGKKVAAFDTRVSTRWASIFGYAAGRIAESLKGKGGNLVRPPEGFFVRGTKGPLKEGELERAAVWAKEISG